MREEASSTEGFSFRPPSAEASEEAIRAVLSQDHDRLERQFESIVTEASCGDARTLRQAWQAFESELFRHFNDEEVHILPVFAQQRPAQAHALLHEHQRIRDELTHLGAELDLGRLSAERIGDFVASLRAHTRSEDDLLYPWAAHRLGEAARRRAHKAMSTMDRKPMSDAETWQIDLEHSSLGFSLRHIVVHEIRGHFAKWGGTMSLDGNDLANASLRVWIDLSSVDTAEVERDDQIRSPEFFDVGRFPQARFTSTQVKLPERANPIVKGRLELHGFTGDLELTVARQNRWTDEKGDEHVSFEASARLDRRKFGLRWNQDLDVGGVVVGDEIEIFAQVEAVRVGSAP